MPVDPLYIILTTYNRQENALSTVHRVLNNLQFDGPLNWILCDDGSDMVGGQTYIHPIVEAIERAGQEVVRIYNGDRRGVGHMMNSGIRSVRELGGDVFLMLEDDWDLQEWGYDFTPDVNLLRAYTDTGMIRYGYISPGQSFHLFTRDSRLWFRMGIHQYRFSGHPSLRHIRFHGHYGMYKEGLPPGETELSMCAQVNYKPEGPMILVPCYPQQAYGLFGHTGTASLKNVRPENA
ncbi:MAG TPA: glycosyltransferase [Bellilinea sp.]|nr:glycosyltransferase [Bellilinea sp.]